MRAASTHLICDSHEHCAVVHQTHCYVAFSNTSTAVSPFSRLRDKLAGFSWVLYSRRLLRHKNRRVQLREQTGTAIKLLRALRRSFSLHITGPGHRPVLTLNVSCSSATLTSRLSSRHCAMPVRLVEHKTGYRLHIRSWAGCHGAITTLNTGCRLNASLFSNSVFTPSPFIFTARTANLYFSVSLAFDSYTARSHCDTIMLRRCYTCWDCSRPGYTFTALSPPLVILIPHWLYRRLWTGSSLMHHPLALALASF